MTKLPPGTELISDPMSMDTEEKARLESFVFEHGQFHDSYLITEWNREIFWSRERRGVIGFLRFGRHLHVIGGLIAPPEDREQLMEDAIEYARLNRLHLTFYNIDDELLGLFRKYHFGFAKSGEEGRLGLLEHTWAGKRYRWAREEVSYVRRQGVTFEEVRKEELSETAWESLIAELRELSRIDLSRRLQRNEPPGLYGRLSTQHLYRRRIFIAREPEEGKILAFLVCTPMLGGRRWSPEMTRRRPDAVKGIVVFLWYHLVETLKAEGAEELTLGVTPAVGCEKDREGHWFIRSSLVAFYRHCDFIYNSAGIHAYKKRYRPVFHNTYLCLYPDVTIGWILSYSRWTGLFDVHPLHTCLAFCRKLWRRSPA